jgi:hypothetical protein
MKAGEGQHDSWQHKNMQSEETRERSSRNNRTAKQQLDQLASHERNAAGD